MRGAHAHKELHQLIVPIHGSFKIFIDNGSEKKEFILNAPNKALYLSPIIWRELSNFSSDSVCLVLASEFFSESDYIRTYKDFIQELKK